MVFSAPVFLFLFLPAVLAAYFLAPRAARNGILLFASLAFYAWGEPKFAIVMLASVAANYVLGVLVGRTEEARARRGILFIAVALNLGLLGFFKYGSFLLGNVNELRAFASPGVTPFTMDPVDLPLGISFFTFHALSYVIDIYRRQATAQSRPLRLALYIAFFPQLVAGPIVRYHEIADQLVSRQVTRSGFALGAERFILGLAKKMLVANTLAVPADAIFALPSSALDAALSWLGIVCYSLQIYFDFSGYSDMAIGLAALFGFKFPENFNYPYAAESLTDFWRRWHISLSNWFRDYLYIPLGGNRVSRPRVLVNLLTIFFLCGLWHGASWNFVIWGMLHGVVLVVERVGFGRVLARMPSVARHAYLLFLVAVTWVPFRSPDLTSSRAFLRAMFGFGKGTGLEETALLHVDPVVALALAVGAITAAPLLPAVREWIRRSGESFGAPVMVARLAALALLFAASAMQLSAGTHNPFIYFKF